MELCAKFQAQRQRDLHASRLQPYLRDGNDTFLTHGPIYAAEGPLTSVYA